MITKAAIILFAMASLCSFNAVAAEMVQNSKQSLPFGIKSIVMQGYGYSGNIAVGVDIPSDSELFHFITLLGVAQQTHSGKRHGLLTLKGNWHPFSPIPVSRSPGQTISWEPFYTGLSVIIHDCIFSDCDDDRVFYELPDKYPADYYPRTAIAFALNMGSSIVFGGSVVYAELVITTQGLDAYYHNRFFLADNYDYWGLKSIASLGIGLKIHY
ncbi:hypothetical protein KKI24_10100 [bacterium]|nr:hypothetical protein [bacterium]